MKLRLRKATSWFRSLPGRCVPLRLQYWFSCRILERRNEKAARDYYAKRLSSMAVSFDYKVARWDYEEFLDERGTQSKRVTTIILID